MSGKYSMQWEKAAAICIGVIMIISCFVGTAYAEGEADSTGDLRVTIEHIEENGSSMPCAQVSVVLYKVGTVTWENGNAKFALNKEYSSVGLDLNANNSNSDMQGAALALEKAVRDSGAEGTEMVSDKNGEVRYKDLQQGVYLITQKQKTDLAVSPMLIRMPLPEKGGYNYIIQAFPKVSFDSSNIPTDKPARTGDQTRIMLWVGLLAGAAILIFIISKLKKKKNDEEEKNR